MDDPRTIQERRRGNCKYVAYSPSGEIYESYSIAKLSSSTGIPSPTITAMLKSPTRASNKWKGWRFEKVNDG